MIDMLALEIVFLAVLFALVVNTNWRRWKPRAGKLKKITVFLLIFAFLACAALWLWYDQDQRRQKAELFARQQAIDARRKRESVLATLPRATPLTNPFDDLIPRAEPGKYASTDPNAGIVGLAEWKEEEKLIHDPIEYQTGNWTTGAGSAFAVAKFFERNLGDRKPDLDALADQLGVQKRYTLIEKQKRGDVWWVRVFLYRQATQTYVVQTGDTLVSISRKFYNSTEHSNAILDANRKSIHDPKKLTVGRTLIIP